MAALIGIVGIFGAACNNLWASSDSSISDSASESVSINEASANDSSASEVPEKEKKVYRITYWSDIRGSQKYVLERESVKEGEVATYVYQPTEEEIEAYGSGEYIWVDSMSNPVDLSSVKKNMNVYISFAWAQYAETAPVIDGTIDTVWDTAQRFDVDNRWEAGLTKGYVKVMWRETGLYFLGVMEDEVVVASDTCNFWVCETATDIMSDYSKNPAEGKYAVCIGSDGQDVWDTDILDVPNVQCKTKLIDGGWVIEVYVPRLSAGGFTENQLIGFDCSIDSYDSDNEERKDYCNWFGAGSYWENVAALYKLPLKKN